MPATLEDFQSFVQGATQGGATGASPQANPPTLEQFQGYVHRETAPPSVEQFQAFVTGANLGHDVGNFLSQEINNQALFSAREYAGGSGTSQFAGSWDETAQRLQQQFPDLTTEQISGMQGDFESARAQAFQGHLLQQHLEQARQQGATSTSSAWYLATRAPFTGGINQAQREAQLRDIVQTIQQGRGTNQDYQILASYMAEQERWQGSGWMGTIADGVLRSGIFALEFGATGGALGLGQAVTNRLTNLGIQAAGRIGTGLGLARGLGGAAGPMTAGVLARAAGFGVGTVAQTAILPGTAAAAQSASMMPQVGVAQGPTGPQINVQAPTNPLSPLGAFTHAAIEIGAERSGAWLMGRLGAAARLIPGGGRITNALQSFSNLSYVRPVMQGVGGQASRYGIGSLPEEMLEERATEVGQYLLGSSPVGIMQTLWEQTAGRMMGQEPHQQNTWSNAAGMLAQEFAVLGITVGGHAALNRIANGQPLPQPNTPDWHLGRTQTIAEINAAPTNEEFQQRIEQFGPLMRHFDISPATLRQESQQLQQAIQRATPHEVTEADLLPEPPPIEHQAPQGPSPGLEAGVSPGTAPQTAPTATAPPQAPQVAQAPPVAAQTQGAPAQAEVSWKPTGTRITPAQNPVNEGWSTPGTFTSPKGQQYRIEHLYLEPGSRESSPHGGAVIRVYDQAGKEVAHVGFYANAQGQWQGEGLHVEPDFRKQGIGEAMYDYMAEVSQAQIVPAGGRTDAGKGFWKRNQQAAPQQPAPAPAVAAVPPGTPKVEAQWKPPNIEEEREEIKRAAQETKKPESAIRKAIAAGQLVPLPVAANDLVPDPAGMAGQMDFQRIVRGLQSGEAIPAPIILKMPSGKYHRLSGGTRLAAARSLGIRPTVLLAEVKPAELEVSRKAMKKAGWSQEAIKKYEKSLKAVGAKVADFPKYKDKPLVAEHARVYLEMLETQKARAQEVLARALAGRKNVSEWTRIEAEYRDQGIVTAAELVRQYGGINPEAFANDYMSLKEGLQELQGNDRVFTDAKGKPGRFGLDELAQEIFDVAGGVGGPAGREGRPLPPVPPEYESKPGDYLWELIKSHGVVEAARSAEEAQERQQQEAYLRERQEALEAEEGEGSLAEEAKNEVVELEPGVFFAPKNVGGPMLWEGEAPAVQEENAAADLEQLIEESDLTRDEAYVLRTRIRLIAENRIEEASFANMAARPVASGRIVSRQAIKQMEERGLRKIGLEGQSLENVMVTSAQAAGAEKMREASASSLEQKEEFTSGAESDPWDTYQNQITAAIELADRTGQPPLVFLNQNLPGWDKVMTELDAIRFLGKTKTQRKQIARLMNEENKNAKQRLRRQGASEKAASRSAEETVRTGEEEGRAGQKDREHRAYPQTDEGKPPPAMTQQTLFAPPGIGGPVQQQGPATPIDPYQLVATIDAKLGMATYVEDKVPGGTSQDSAFLDKHKATLIGSMQSGNAQVRIHEAGHHIATTNGFLDDARNAPADVQRGFVQFDYVPNRRNHNVALHEGFAEWLRRRSIGQLQGLTPQQEAAARWAENWIGQKNLRAKLDSIRDLFRQMMAQGPVQQAGGFLGTGEVAAPVLSAQERADNWWTRLRSWWKDAVTNNLDAFNRAGMKRAHTAWGRLHNADAHTAREMGRLGTWTIINGQKAYIGLSQEKIVEHLLPEDLESVSKSSSTWASRVKDLFHKPEQITKAEVFAIANHVIQEVQAGRPNPVSPQMLAYFQQAMAEFRKDPAFVGRALIFSSRLTRAFNSTLVALAAPEVHFLNPQKAQDLIAARPNYISLMRVKEKPGPKTGFLKPRTGSGDQIVSPLRSYEKRLAVTAFLLNEQLRKNAVAQYLLQPNMAEWGLLSEQQLTPAGVAEFTQIAQRLGITDIEAQDVFEELGMDAGLYYVAQPWSSDPNKNTWYWHGPDGKPMSFRIKDHALYDLITHQQGDASAVAQFFHWLGRIGIGGFKPFQVMAEAVRTGATYLDLSFQARNIPRDAHTFLGNTADMASTGNLPQAMARAFAFEWAMATGQVSSDVVFELFIRERGRLFRKFSTEELAWLRGKAEALNNFINVASAAELAPRFQEFINRLKELGWDQARLKAEITKAKDAAKRGRDYVDPVPWEVLQDAMEYANEVTVPFSRQGYITREINKLVPFFGPAISGSAKWLRNWKANPKGAAVALSATLALTLLHWLRYKDEPWYQELSPYDRYNNFVVNIPGLGLRRLPKQRGFDVPISGALLYVLDLAQQRNPKFADLLEQSMAAVLPPPPIPPAAKVAWELQGNRNWMGSPIVPRRAEHATAMENFWNYQLPYAAEQLFAGVGSIGDVARRGLEGLMPFSQVRNANQSVNAFYEAYEQAERAGDVPWTLQRVRTLMGQLRNSGVSRDTLQPYLIGLARYAMGQQALPSYPNPLNDPGAPQALRQVTDQFVGGLLIQGTSPMPQRRSGETQAHYQQRLGEWQQMHQQIGGLLGPLNLTPAQRASLLRQAWLRRGGSLTGPAYGQHLQRLAGLFGGG
jgi:GNAT superfamily N-acetyltransferase